MTDATMTTTTDIPVSPTDPAGASTPLGGAFAVDAGKVQSHLDRVVRETVEQTLIRRQTRVVGAFPDGHSAVMLAAARLRHVADTDWGERAYLDMKLLRDQDAKTKTPGEGMDRATADVTPSSGM